MDASTSVELMEQTVETIVETVDLTPVLDQLSQVTQWQQNIFCAGLVLVGAVIGLGAALVIRGVLR